MNAGIHVITPNKRLTSAALNYYQAVQRAQFHLPDGSLRPPGHATRVFYEVQPDRLQICKFEQENVRESLQCLSGLAVHSDICTAGAFISLKETILITA